MANLNNLNQEPSPQDREFNRQLFWGLVAIIVIGLLILIAASMIAPQAMPAITVIPTVR